MAIKILAENYWSNAYYPFYGQESKLAFFHSLAKHSFSKQFLNIICNAFRLKMHIILSCG